jgi:predicted membrane chloride channel (bestrophin family)
MHAQPRGAPDWPPRDSVSVLYQPFVLSSFAMSLLMVFRTNSSYARCGLFACHACMHA